MNYNNNNNKRSCSGRAGSGALLGLFLVVVGAFWVLTNTGVIHFYFHSWWPLILIGVGILSIGGSRGRDAFFGWLILGLGIYFFLSENHLVDRIYFRKYWPVILILVGFYFIFAHSKPGRSRSRDGSGNDIYSDDEFSETAVFNEIDRKFTSNKFKGGSVTSIFDDVNLDLTECRLDDSGADISGTAIFDDIVIRVPKDMPIKIRSTTIFGSVKNRTENPAPTNEKYLDINVTAIFGDVKVIN